MYKAVKFGMLKECPGTRVSLNVKRYVCLKIRYRPYLIFPYKTDTCMKHKMHTCQESNVLDTGFGFILVPCRISVSSFVSSTFEVLIQSHLLEQERK